MVSDDAGINDVAPDASTLYCPSTHLFLPASNQYNNPSKIVTLGYYYPQGRIAAAKNLVREAHQTYRTDNSLAPDSTVNPRIVHNNISWTRLINALNNERQWPLKRLYEMLDPMLELGIAIAVVPPHRAYNAFWPMRTLAQKLAASERMDATSCLVRHTTIRRIIYGGPSNRDLHRQTLQTENTELINGQRVLLLDDIAKSGASLVACREMLYEAGATAVQAVALGRVIVDVQG